MSLLKALEDAKQFGLESDNIERNAYNGHAFGNEMVEIDEIVSIMDIGTEGELYTDIELAPIFSAYTVEGEQIDFTIDFEGFGMEAVMEKIKGAGSKTWAFIKKMGKIIVGLVKRMINVVVNKNLALKKYGKVITTLIQKLDSKTFKDGEKKVKIHELDGLAALVESASAVTGATVQASTNAIKKSKNWNSLYNLVVGDLVWLTNSDELKDPTAEKLETIIKEKKVLIAFDKEIEACQINETEETATAAKSKVLALAKSLDKKLEENVKIQGNLRDYAAALEAQVDKLTTSDALEGYQEGDSKDEATEQYKTLQKVGSVVAQSQAAYTKLFKHTTKCLGTLIADMRKVLSA